MSLKRKTGATLDPDTFQVLPLGAGNELDCGFHPAYSGMEALPFFDSIDPADVDVVLITHYHLDHAAALPYFLERTHFKGRVFMTHATKAIYRLLLSDFVRISNIAAEEGHLYSEAELARSMDRIEQIDYREEVDVGGIRFSAYMAGHVLGAAMFMVEIAGVKLLYTGDFSHEEDRHLMAAEVPPIKPDVLVVESTYGVQIHEPRREREARFTGTVRDVVKRGGRCLIPAFALGRAQELLLILDEYWDAHPELKQVPVYYASALAKKSMAVYRTYVNMMNAKIRAQFALSNPFHFRHVKNLRQSDLPEDIGPCVVMASPGMLQSGLSRRLFERWCSDQRNGVVMPGYCVEGTLAKHILSEPQEITASSGVKMPMRLSVHYISFSAHSDFAGTSTFIDKLMPTYVILVHGDKTEMGRLKTALVQRYEKDHLHVLTPMNCQPVELQFRGEKFAKVVGTKGQARPEAGLEISGVLVKKDYAHLIMGTDDLPQFTQLTTTTVSQRQYVPFTGSMEALRLHLRELYADVSEEADASVEGQVVGGMVIKVHDTVTVYRADERRVTMEWLSSPVNDLVADSVLGVLLQIEANPITSKSTPESIKQNAEQQHLIAVQTMLLRHFSEVDIDAESMTLLVKEGRMNAVIDRTAQTVTGDSGPFNARVQGVLKRIDRALYPIS